MARSSLYIHHQTQHSVARGGARKNDNRGDGGRGDDTRTFRMTFLSKARPMNFTVEGCSVQEATRIAMQVHLWHLHVLDTVVILE